MKQFNTTEEYDLQIKGGVLKGAECMYSLRYCTLKTSQL